MKDLEDIKSIYDKAFRTFGDDTRSCLWGEPQIMRYGQLSKIADLSGSTVLDVGCGLGGFYEFLHADCGYNISYTGIDIVEGMLDTAQKKYPKAIFKKVNILEEDLRGDYDYVFLCGVFNNNTENADDYMKKILEKSFQYCKKGMAFNFISTYVNYKDVEMTYHSPEEVLHFCINNLSKKVQINHHYGKSDVSVYIYR